MNDRPQTSLGLTLLAFALRNRRRELGLSCDQVEARLRFEDIDGPSYETVERGRAPLTLAVHLSEYASALDTSTPALLGRAASDGFAMAATPDEDERAVWTMPALNESRRQFITKRREELEMTKEDVAAEMRRLSPELDPYGPEDRTNKESVSNMENGRIVPSMRKIVLLAGALRVSPVQLCALNPDIDPEEYGW